MIFINQATIILATLACSRLGAEASDPNAFCWGFGTNCRGCLTEGCKFDGAQCVPTCSGGACYTANTWPELSILGTCRRAKTIHSPPDNCSSFGTNCRGCLEAGCKFDGDQCIPNCNHDAQDKGCYGPNTWPELSILGTCRRAKNDAAIPFSSASTKQAEIITPEATNVVSFNAESTQHGEIATPEAANSVPVVTAKSAGPATDGLSRARQSCARARDCNACIENGCNWTGSQCFKYCGSPNTCYNQELFPGWSNLQICQRVKYDQAKQGTIRGAGNN